MSLLWILALLLVFVVDHTDSTKKATANDHVLEATPFFETKDFAELHRSLRFDPPEIDFGTWSVGAARSQKVTLVNENTNRSVYLSSVSGRTPIFYSSFFESRVVPPMANTTFEVVFLPRKSSMSSDYLYLHTSFGQARLLVRGEGLECPYRLQPIVGIKAPLNALLTPEIYLYNPHNRPLQILEVYSSGGQFQLELPSGLASAPQALWEIPPHTTKPIIRIKFHGTSAGNHTAFIRIKIAPHADDDGVTMSKINSENVLVVPVEFEISPEQGMFAEKPILDFGRLTNTKLKKPLQLYMHLRNSDELHSMEKVSLAEGESLISGLNLEEIDGSFTLDTHTFNKTTSLDEVLTLQGKSEDNKSIGPTFTVRVRAQIYKGTLHFNRNTTIFITERGTGRSKEGDTRTLIVRNDFEIPLSLLSTNIGRNDSNAIQVNFSEKYHDGLTLRPGESFELAKFQLMNSSIRYQTQLLIKTNIINFELPVVICTGRLTVMTFNEPIIIPSEKTKSITQLNMGTVPLGEMSQEGYIVLYNENPITVKLTKWDFEAPRGVYFHATSMGCMRSAALELFSSNKSVNIERNLFRFCKHLNEGDISVFEIAVQSYLTELLTSTLRIWTPYENIITNIVFHTWIGKLEVDQDQLHFKNCFPGKICTSELSIHSTFQQPIHLTSINFTNPSLRFETELNENFNFALSPNTATRLGRILFEPAVYCQNRCYLQLDEKQNSLAFPSHLVNENNNFHFDETELRRRTELYRQMKWYFRDITFTVRSRELRQLQLHIFIDIEWPKLVKNGKQKFPNIEAGKTQEQIVTIRNPADKPLLVDYFLSDPKYAQQTKLSLPLEVVTISSSCYLTDKNVFSIRNQKGSRLDVPIVIPPQGSTEVVVRFEAPTQERDTFCTLLHIRNNLTLYEAVWLRARVVQSQFRFGNRKPGSSTPLLYDLQEKHFSACPAPVFVKRTFTARNTGEVPIWIETFLIDEQECEGYGFKVYNCGKGFELKTNQSRKIEIAFRPDFTASRVTHTLTIRTNLSYQINYTLHAQLPHTSLLEPCTRAIQRPLWEDKARIAGLFLLLTSFVLVIAAAHVDSESISQTQSALYIAREKGPVHPTFNLRNIVKAASLSNNNSGSNSNGRQQTKSNNHCLSSKASNQQQLKKRAASSSGGYNVKKYQLNSSFTGQTSPTARNPNCIDPFSVTEHSDTLLGASKATLNESLSKTISGKNQKNENEKIIQQTSNNDATNKEKNESTTAPVNQKNPSPVSNRTDYKKQKTPPLQSTSATQSVQSKQNKFNAKGKPRNLNQIQITPPLAQNPIIELMDKEVKPDVPIKEEKNIEKSAKLIEKRTISKSVVSTTTVVTTDVTTNSNISANRAVTVNTNTPKLSPTLNPSKSATSNSSQQKTTRNASTTPPAAINRTTPPMTMIIPNNTKKTSQTVPTILKIDTASTAVNTSEQYSISRISQSSTHNKYGKTPGRERRKEKNELHEHRAPNATTLSAASSSSSLASTGSNAAKRSERKEKTTTVGNKKIQMQTLEEPKRTTAIKNESNISSLFEVTGTQKVTLNDILEVANKNERATVLKSSSANTTPVNADYPSLLDKAMRHIDLNEKPKSALKSVPLAQPYLKEVQQPFENRKAVELGPIGSKKSPSSTPVWEFVGANNTNSTVSVRTPLQPKPTDSNSFFSNFMDGPEHNYEFNNVAVPFMGESTTDLYELRKAQAELRRQLSANEYLLKIRQQQLKDQFRRQQHQQHQKHQQDMMQNMTTAHWNHSEESTWKPIHFDAHLPSMVMGEDNNNKAMSATGGLENLTGHWQSTPVRPPPGLGVAPSPANFLNGLAPQQPTLAHNNNNYNNNNNNNGTQKEQEQARIFDPFSSLSSIWSDNWKQLHKKDDNFSHGHGQGQNQGQGYKQ